MQRVCLIFLIIFICSITVTSQIPAGYYNDAVGKTGEQLKYSLYTIISVHDVCSYANIWTNFYYTDRDANGKIWDMYSGGCNYVYSTDQCVTINYTSECECYNREHSLPKSWFDDANPMYTDMHMIFPADAYVNERKSNYPLGEVTIPTFTSDNGTKVGYNSLSGYSGYAFEPIDEYKGDFARAYLYMATCYHNLVSSWELNGTYADAVFDGTSYPSFEPWFAEMLVRWNAIDPVSQKEVDRNNYIYYNIQHNRNPYIDHPEYVAQIWDAQVTAPSVDGCTAAINIYPVPASGHITIEVSPGFGSYRVTIADITGKPLVVTDVQKSDSLFYLPLSISAGVYLLQVANSEKVITRLITLQ